MSSSTRRQCINAICIFHSLVNLSVWISSAANVRMGVHISRGLQSISEYKGMLTTFAFYEASPPPDMLAERHPALFTTARWNTMHKSAFTRPTAVKSMITIRWFIDFAKIRIYNRSMHSLFLFDCEDSTNIASKIWINLKRLLLDLMKSTTNISANFSMDMDGIAVCSLYKRTMIELWSSLRLKIDEIHVFYELFE